MSKFQIENWESFKTQTKPRVLVLITQAPKPAIDLLENMCHVIQCDYFHKNEEEIMDKVIGVDAILWPNRVKITQALIDKAGSNLKVISVAGTYDDNKDCFEDIKSDGIKIAVTNDITCDAVADHAIGLMINAARRMYEISEIRSTSNFMEKTRDEIFAGLNVIGQTIGFVGFTNLGQAIAKRMIGFDVNKIIFYSPTTPLSLPQFKVCVNQVNFYELLTESDVLFVNCALNWQSENLINEDAFRTMKPNCVLVNVSKGKIIDEKALIEALQKKKIFAAGLDVFEKEPLETNNPLLKLPNCILTPQIGVATERTRIDLALVAAHNILRALSHEPLVGEL